MSGFDNRKDAFEAKHAHDEGVKFKVEARTCKLFGLWVAEQLGLKDKAAEDYAKEVVGSNLEEAGFDDVKRKVTADIKKKNLDIATHMLDKQLEKAMTEAKAQITAGK